MFIGISGGIGSGKSTVASIFKTLNIPVYNADSEAKKLYHSNAQLKELLINRFGEKVYPQGIFDKKALAEIVFNDKIELNALNAMVHPLVLEHSLNWSKEQVVPYCLKEAALLFESGSYKFIDKVIVVSAPKPLRMKRVIERDGMDESQVEARMNKQMAEDKKVNLADYIVSNGQSDMLIPQVLHIHQSILELV